MLKKLGFQLKQEMNLLQPSQKDAKIHQNLELKRLQATGRIENKIIDAQTWEI